VTITRTRSRWLFSRPCPLGGTLLLLETPRLLFKRLSASLFCLLRFLGLSEFLAGLRRGHGLCRARAGIGGRRGGVKFPRRLGAERREDHRYSQDNRNGHAGESLDAGR
jgi:hypothetical protein